MDGDFSPIGNEGGGGAEILHRQAANQLERRAVLETIQQLEQRVLFQLMLGAGPQEDTVARQVIAAVQEGQLGLPDPTQAPAQIKRKKKNVRRGPPRSRRRR